MKEIYNAAKICPYGQKPYSSHEAKPYQPATYYSGENNPELAFLDQTRIQGTNGHQVFRNYDGNTYTFNSQETAEYPNYCDMQLDPEISRILAHSRIESELLYVWKSFRDKTGPKLKNRFMRYVQLANQAAVATGMFIC